MAVSLDTVVKQLEESGVVSPGKLESFVPPKAHPKDGEELLRQLFKQNLLTKYQAQQVALGKAKSLILGNYTLLDKIGAGGMGQVFKAEHRRMKRLVAIKMLPAAMLKDAAAVARFQREVEAAAKLRHPNIVAADDADQANGVHFLVMEYVEGSDLSALVKKNGPFSVEKSVSYILQAARGLEFAHGEGVVHRDIKPANLLLDKRGTVKILDMGLARIESEGNTATQAELTGTGAVMGTVDYMAPEQAEDTHTADARADIYSLGCSLYYLLAGECLCDGDSLMAKLLAHRDKPIPSLKDVPSDVESVFRKMVAKQASDRYQTMAEVIADLEPCVTGASVSIQQVGGDTDSGLKSFLKEIPAPTVVKPKATKPNQTKPTPAKATLTKTGQGNKAFILGGVGAAILGVLILAGIIVWLQPKGGARNGAGNPSGTSSSSQLFMYDPAFPQWLAQVQALPAEEQLKAVSLKLQNLNPGFDGRLYGGKAARTDDPTMPKIENGVVTEIGLYTESVVDLSPVRAFAGLKVLKCSWSDKGKLSDLSPLKGMQLTELSCHRTGVSDLSPLIGMPLTAVDCGLTYVDDLSPLSGMQLTYLDCASTKVSDFSPLRGMPLKKIGAMYCKQLVDLAPLTGMPLDDLGLGSNAQLTDERLAPLFTLKSLKKANLSGTSASAAFVDDLKQALPSCNIVWDDPAKTTTPAPAPTGTN